MCLAIAKHVAANSAPCGTHMYCPGSDGHIYCFNVQEGQLDHLIKSHGELAAVGLAHRPHRNLLASIADGSDLKMWRAA